MTRRASMWSSNRPTSGEINPLDSAITLGSKETRARPQPKCLTRAGIKTGTVLYPPPKATKSVTHRLATIIQPRRSRCVMQFASSGPHFSRGYYGFDLEPAMRMRIGSPFGEYLRVVRKLLKREAVKYTTRDAHEIRFMHEDGL